MFGGHLSQVALQKFDIARTYFALEQLADLLDQVLLLLRAPFLLLRKVLVDFILLVGVQERAEVEEGLLVKRFVDESNVIGPKGPLESDTFLDQGFFERGGLLVWEVFPDRSEKVEAQVRQESDEQAEMPRFQVTQ